MDPRDVRVGQLLKWIGQKNFTLDDQHFLLIVTEVYDRDADTEYFEDIHAVSEKDRATLTIFAALDQWGYEYSSYYFYEPYDHTFALVADVPTHV